MKQISLLLATGLIFISCSGSSYNTVALEELETDVIEDREVISSEVEIFLSDSQIQQAYDSFLAKGVPQVALQRAFAFYRQNRAVNGGLKDLLV